MLAYFFIYSTFLFFTITSFFDKKSTNVVFLFLVFLLVFFSGFRDEIGVDYPSYRSYFYLLNVGYEVPVEKSFKLLTNFVDNIGGKHQLVFLFYSFFTVLFLSEFIKEFSSNKVFSLFIFFCIPVFYLSTFNTMRQWLAVSVFAYSLKYLVNKELIRYAVLICIAAAIHKTAIFLLPLYFVLDKKLNIISQSIIIVSFIFFLKIVDIIVVKTGFSQIYLEGNNFEEDKGVSLFIFPLIFLFILLNKLKIENKNLVLNMIFFSILISSIPLFTDNLPNKIVLRVTSYFTIILLIVIPNVTNLFKNYKVKFIYILFVFFLSNLYFFRNVAVLGELYKLVPFKFNFQLF